MAEPGVTSVEVYGFVGWIASAVVYVLYLLWAYVPDRTLHFHGVSYYPSKYWAIAFPTWVCVTVVAVYWIYEGLNMMSAPPELGSLQSSAGGAAPNQDPATYFNPAGTSTILPLRVLPQELVDLVLKEGLAPHEAGRVYKERLGQRTASAAGQQQAAGASR